MSDDFMAEEDYGFEYEDDEGEEPDITLENQYYNSKASKEEQPQESLRSFQQVISMEAGNKGEWGFKACKQMVKIYFRTGQWKECIACYCKLLTYIKSAVTRNYSEKSIQNILDIISSADDMNFMESFYDTTLHALEEDKNERLWFKTNLKLAKLWLDRLEYGRLQRILRQLHLACKAEDGTDDLKKGTQLLEVYALEIQMYTAQKDNKKLREFYHRSLHVKSAIPHPKIMAIIRECGGKMHMRQEDWEKAHIDFFEAFKNYDEAGSPRRLQCLKYLVLANMLMMSKINPFESQETISYKNDPEILAMTNLVDAYQSNEIEKFETILRENQKTIMDDPFIRSYIEDLLKNIRTQVLLHLIKPYSRIQLDFISNRLNIPIDEVENLIGSLILDRKIHGYIDQINNRLELSKEFEDSDQIVNSKNLLTRLDNLRQEVLNKIA